MRGRLTEKFVVRLPKDVRHLIEERAESYHRSMNSEIVIRLEQSLKGLPSLSVETELEPPFQSSVERMFKDDLSTDEETLVMAIRRLSPSRQKALLDLLS